MLPVNHTLPKAEPATNTCTARGHRAFAPDKPSSRVETAQCKRVQTIQWWPRQIDTFGCKRCGVAHWGRRRPTESIKREGRTHQIFQ